MRAGKFPLAFFLFPIPSDCYCWQVGPTDNRFERQQATRRDKSRFCFNSAKNRRRARQKAPPPRSPAYEAREAIEAFPDATLSNQRLKGPFFFVALVLFFHLIKSD